jgi:hypothetical protein
MGNVDRTIQREGPVGREQGSREGPGVRTDVRHSEGLQPLANVGEALKYARFIHQVIGATPGFKLAVDMKITRIYHRYYFWPEILAALKPQKTVGNDG